MATISKTDCVLWTGRISKTGYGGKDRHTYAHRDAWEMEFGPIPEGLIVHHTCGVKHCVNVDHMALMTQGAHSRLHGWGAAGTCKHGHPWTPDNIVRKRDGRLRCLTCRRRDAREAARRRRAAA